MPNFHIEVKGTVSAKIERSKIRGWIKQIQTDCPENQISVIFHQANGVDPIGIMLASNYKKITFDEVFNVSPATVIVEVEDSWNPNMLIKQKELSHTLESYLNEYKLLTDNILAGYEVADTFIVACRGESLVGKMLNYEARIKADV